MGEQKRKSISNKIRFEIFKRDNFTCQYCGKKSPEVILNVDHIEPVSKGGSNDTFNLITSCFECNNGKSDRRLNDNEMLNKQRNELEELNERKKQLDMLLQWKNELRKLDEIQFEAIEKYISNSIGHDLSDIGLEKLKRWSKKYSLNELFEATDKALEQYYDKDPNFIFEKIERIAYYTKNPAPEYIKESRYIIGILRNRKIYYNENQVRELLEKWKEYNLDFEQARLIAKNAKNWTIFKYEMLSVIEVSENE